MQKENKLRRTGEKLFRAPSFNITKVNMEFVSGYKKRGLKQPLKDCVDPDIKSVGQLMDMLLDEYRQRMDDLKKGDK